MLVAKLVPQIVEGFIVGTEDYVAESGKSLLPIWLAEKHGLYYSCSIVSVTSSTGRNWRSSPGYLKRRHIFCPLLMFRPRRLRSGG